MDAIQPQSARPTLVTFLLDRTGSMLKIKEATIEAFNGYLAGLQGEAEAVIEFTHLQFDSISLDQVCVAVPVRDAQLLTESTYLPRGSTPLIEAAIKTIRAVEESLSSRTDNPKIVIGFQTDGEENCSGPDYTWDELNKLVKAKQEIGWQFNFMGAGIDAYEQGAKMGIAPQATMSYNSNNAGNTRAAFAASANNAAGFAAGRMSSTAYSASDRKSSGDAYAPDSLMIDVAARVAVARVVKKEKRGILGSVNLKK